MPEICQAILYLVLSNCRIIKNNNGQWRGVTIKLRLYNNIQHLLIFLTLTYAIYIWHLGWGCWGNMWSLGSQRARDQMKLTYCLYSFNNIQCKPYWMKFTCYLYHSIFNSLRIQKGYNHIISTPAVFWINSF